jgi:hypothetical protein
MNDIGLRAALERAAGTDIFFIPSRGNTSRRRNLSKATEEGGIKYDQSYGAGSAEDAVSERRALVLHRKNGRKSNRSRVLSVS